MSAVRIAFVWIALALCFVVHVIRAADTNVPAAVPTNAAPAAVVPAVVAQPTVAPAPVKTTRADLSDSDVARIVNPMKSKLESGATELEKAVNDNATALKSKSTVILAISILSFLTVAAIAALLIPTARSSARDVKNLSGVIGNVSSVLDSRVQALSASVENLQTTQKAFKGVVEDAKGAVERVGSQGIDKITELVSSSQVSELTQACQTSAEQLGDLKNRVHDAAVLIQTLQGKVDGWIDDFESRTNSKLAKIDEMAQRKVGAAEERLRKLDQARWPVAFLEGGSLASDRKKIEDRAAQGDAAAAELMQELSELRMTIGRGASQVDRLGEIMMRLGNSAYAFWKGELDYSEEMAFDAAQRWVGELNAMLTAQRAPLSLRIIMPRAVFDMSTMLSEKSISGNTSRVKEPLSWAVLETMHGEEKILSPGRVITE